MNKNILNRLLLFAFFSFPVVIEQTLFSQDNNAVASNDSGQDEEETDVGDSIEENEEDDESDEAVEANDTSASGNQEENEYENAYESEDGSVEPAENIQEIESAIPVKESEAGLSESEKTNGEPIKDTEGKSKSSKSSIIIEADNRETIDTNTVIFNFKNAKLQSLIDWIAQVHNVSFIPDDLIKGGNKPSSINIDQHTISFSTKTPLTKKQSWSLFTTFLDLAGMTIISGPEDDFYRIIPSKDSTTAVLPTYINIEPEELPSSDAPIRYVYFLQNTTPDQIKGFIDTLKMASYHVFNELKGLIFTDRASKIRSIMKIVKELDKASQPEALKVIQLKLADVGEVVKLYKTLAGKEETSRPYGFAPKKEPTLFYFPKDVNLFEEKRTNSLIILGPKKDIEKVHKFIIDYIDKPLESPHSPLHQIILNYTDATQMADMLNQVTKFAPDTDAAKFGGVRGGEKYFKPMMFSPVTASNSLLVNASEEDYPHIEKIVKQLDVKQLQVATEVLIVNVSASKNKQMGMHLRNKGKDLLGRIDFQTSGMPISSGSATSVLVDQQKGLMANLIDLAQGNAPGSTLLTFGAANNIWGLLKFLETHTRTKVISNPFLITTNRYEAKVKTGTIRRVTTSTIKGATTDGTTKGDKEAVLEVKLTPRISEERVGVINLQIEVNITDFTDPNNQDSAERIAKRIITNANVVNREILVLGGLMRDKENENESSVPLLGRIPVLGWAFKNKSKGREKESLLIFISPRIIETKAQEVGAYTARKAQEAHDFSQHMGSYIESEKRDPVYRWFFKESKENASQAVLDEFLEGKKIHGADSTTVTFQAKSSNSQVVAISEGRSKRSLVNIIDQESVRNITDGNSSMKKGSV